MKVIIEQTPNLTENQVMINYTRMDDEISDLINYLDRSNKKVIGKIDKELFVLEPTRIYYIESVDKKTFIYGDDQVYESAKRLYEYEKELEGKTFFRASKSLILNINKINSVRALLDGRFEAHLKNGEKVFISRKFVPVLKAKLGL